MRVMSLITNIYVSYVHDVANSDCYRYISHEYRASNELITFPSVIFSLLRGIQQNQIDVDHWHPLKSHVVINRPPSGAKRRLVVRCRNAVVRWKFMNVVSPSSINQ